MIKYQVYARKVQEQIDVEYRVLLESVHVSECLEKMTELSRNTLSDEAYLFTVETGPGMDEGVFSIEPAKNKIIQE